MGRRLRAPAIILPSFASRATRGWRARRARRARARRCCRRSACSGRAGHDVGWRCRHLFWLHGGCARCAARAAACRRRAANASSRRWRRRTPRCLSYPRPPPTARTSRAQRDLGAHPKGGRTKKSQRASNKPALLPQEERHSGAMNEFNRRPAYTVAELASTRQHQLLTGRPSWSAR